MDREVLCESLIVWLETFNLDVPHGNAEELSDGIAMSKVLHQIAPDYFTDSWLSRVKTEDVTNWRLKILGIQIHDFQMPDVNAIGESSNHIELGRLLQLILGCAVNCTEKQEYIQRIMSMEESVQHAVMTAIQELMTKEIATDVDSEVGEQLRRTVDELNNAVTVLQEEKQNLAIENDRLAERLNIAENLDDPTSPTGKRFQQVQHQLEQCQEENYKLETAKDDFRIKIEVLQKEVNDLQDRNTELSGLTEECRDLKDELDDLRHTAEQVIKYEAQIDSYKKRMEELSDLRGQVKLLEEKNTKYMQENLELQEELRKSGSVKQQLDVYKRQVHELQTRITEETKRADKQEFEVKRVQEKVNTLQREKERILTERDSLREVNEELSCTQQQHPGAGDELSASSQMEMLSLPPEIKEKILRLEHENKMLRLQERGDGGEQTQVLQTMLDDANSRKNELETEIRLANQKNNELEARIEDLHETAKSSVSSSELMELRKKLEEQVQITQQKDRIVSNERQSVADLQTQLSERATEGEKLRDELNKKEEEKRVMSEKYMKYFDRARAVISSQEQKLKSTGNYYPEVQSLKQQMQEKDKLIEQLKKDQEKTKTTFEQEEKMMGIQLHRQAAVDRLESSTGQAFLNRQRQVHLRGNQQRIPNSHPARL
ncbi:HOOK3-like protein [Mya arenaria]|uniref:HOOK3-like protein n=1 Tax=Mya arenaria TaxID=6604 RepID=A0ABY7FR63_MYAAR|nr:HOOK3-like protein [Mya arenaria]